MFHKFLEKFCSPNTISPYKFQIFNSVIEFESNYFKQEIPFYFQVSYLKILEKNNVQTLDFKYLMIFENNIPKGILLLQIVDVDIKTMMNNYTKNFCFIGGLGFTLSRFKTKSKLKVLVAGNCFLSGHYGQYFENDTIASNVFEILGDCLEDYADEIKNVDLVVLKDLKQQWHFAEGLMAENQFNTIQSEPVMILDLDKNWTSFNDYLSSLKTKFRTKAKSAFSKSQYLTSKELDVEEIAENLSKMKVLYGNVESNASFNICALNLDTYYQFKKELGQNFIIKAYYLNNEMVGFLTAMRQENSLDAHFVGIDYNFNKEHAIYQRMLYDYIDFGISQKVKSINFGRTATEIKSTVGAKPYLLPSYIKHRSKITNKLLKPIFKSVQADLSSLRMPFKELEVKV